MTAPGTTRRRDAVSPVVPGKQEHDLTRPKAAGGGRVPRLPGAHGAERGH
jgi:hypothetical protein